MSDENKVEKEIENKIEKEIDVSEVVKQFHRLPKSQQLYTAAHVLKEYLHDKAFQTVSTVSAISAASTFTVGNLITWARTESQREKEEREARLKEEQEEYARVLKEQEWEICQLAALISSNNSSHPVRSPYEDMRIAKHLYQCGVRMPRKAGSGSNS